MLSKETCNTYGTRLTLITRKFPNGLKTKYTKEALVLRTSPTPLSPCSKAGQAASQPVILPYAATRPPPPPLSTKVYECIYTCICLSSHIYIHIFIHVHRFIYIYRLLTCIHIYIHSYTLVHTNIHLDILIYSHIL